MKVKECPKCDGCPMRKLFPENNLVPPKSGRGNRLAVAEAPGAEEAALGEPLVGPSGRVMNMLWGKAGVSRDSLTIINTINCRPPNNVYPTDKDARGYISEQDAKDAVSHCYREHVEPVLNSRPWGRIDAIGEKSLRALTGKTDGVIKWRGSPLPLKGTDKPLVIPILHPAYIMRQQDYIPYTISDLEKGVNVPPENYNLDPTVESLSKFFDAPQLCFDIETNMFTGAITMVGLSIKATEVTVVPFRGAFIPVLKQIFSTAKSVIGQNIIQFDLPILAENGVTIAEDCQIWDIMLMFHLLHPDAPAKNLEFISSVYTQKPAWKHLSGENMALYCFTPNHKLLGTDLRWNAASTFKVGDTVLGFDENGPNRKYRKATITHIEYADEPTFNVELKSGHIFTVTKEHRWLVQNKSKGSSSSMHWSETQHLRPLDTYGEGQETKIPKLLDVWKQDFGRAAGWLAGMLDGEGSVKSSCTALQVAQNPGLILDLLKSNLKEYIDFGESLAGHTRKTKYLRIRGSKADKLRLLGMLRPERLIHKIDFDKLGRLENRKYTDAIVSVKPAGIQRIIKITTDTSTLIVDGYPMHNCSRDVDVTLQSYLQLKPLLRRLQLEDLYNYTQVPLAKICHGMNTIGIKTDGNRLKYAQEKIAKEEAELIAQLPDDLKPHKIAIKKRAPAPAGTLSPKTGKPIKFIMVEAEDEVVPLNSPKIIEKFLYEILGLLKQIHPKTKKVTTDKNALDRLFRKTKNPVLKAINRLRQLEELKSTFLKEKVVGVGRVHSNFLVHGTNSGRLSSSGPNLQNLNAAAKYIYTPSHADWVFIEADFSSLENRLTAWYANDWERLRKLATPGYNEHKEATSRIFGIPVADITKEMPEYRLGKAANHAANYGLGPRKFAMTYDITEKEAKDILLKWRLANPLTVQWQERTSKIAARDGVLTTNFGRKRWFWTTSTYTESLSFLPQSSGADICFRAMIALCYEQIKWPAEKALKVAEVLAPLPHPARLVAQVHDSLLIECPLALRDAVIEAMRKAMAQPWKELGGFSIPVEFKVGQPNESWAELKALEIH